MPRVINCPECSLSMQPFFAEGGQGARVELDRCPKCTRLWFDVRELEAAVGKPFLPRLRGADASHPCPVCKLALGTSLIRGDVPIEECGSCGGALLDDHDFELISGKALKEAKQAKQTKQAKQPPPPRPPGPKLVEFTCAQCRNRFPLSEAGNLKGSTVCRKCELAQPGASSTGGGGLDDLGELLDDVVETLFDWNR